MYWLANGLSRSRLIRVLHRVNKYFPKSILVTIYKSLITPIITVFYCGVVDVVA